MSRTGFYRVMSYLGWSGNAAVMIDEEAGTHCVYEWEQDDHLLTLTFYRGAEEIDTEFYQFGRNPLPEMWWDSGQRREEPYSILYLEVD